MLVNRMRKEPGLNQEILIFNHYCKSLYIDLAKKNIDYLPVEDLSNYYIENYLNRFKLLDKSFSNMEKDQIKE